MNCLVLGGGGFLGSHVCDSLISARHAVRVFEKEGRDRENLAHAGSGAVWLEGDFLNPENLKAAVKGMDVVFHLVSTTLPKSSNESPVYDVSSNVVATLHLLEAARSAGVRKVIFFSSGGTVYGIPEAIPIPENHSTEPTCSYGIHKLMIEKYLALYHRLHGLDYTVIRLANPYGERQKPTGTQGAIGVLLYKALKGEPLEIWGDGSIIRDYLHVSDVARAALAAIDAQVPERIVNIGSSKGLSLNEIIQLIEEEIGSAPEVRYRQARKFDVPANILEITRARRHLGWSPEVDIRTGIRRTAAYLREMIRSESDAERSQNRQAPGTGQGPVELFTDGSTLRPAMRRQ